jgi:hypothetical protein
MNIIKRGTSNIRNNILPDQPPKTLKLITTNLGSKTIFQCALLVDETPSDNIYTIGTLKGKHIISFDNRSRNKNLNRFFPESQH